MSSDVFRFDTLLKIREQRRDERRRERSAAEADKDAKLDALARLESESRDNLAQWRLAQEKASLDPAGLKRYRTRQDRLTGEKEKLLAELEQADRRLDERTRLFEEAVRDVRVLENLRERKIQQRRTAELDGERKALDEIGSKPS